jgi:hypothetical protein
MSRKNPSLLFLTMIRPHFRIALLTPVMIGVGLALSPVRALPPAPPYTIFGNVRDQYGVLLPSKGAFVVTYVGLKETQRQEVVDVPSANYNYQMRLRLDMTRPETLMYHPKALARGAIFNLAVVRGNRIYRPIEVASPPTVGAAADRRRLDLTLGVDLDGDGLPDAWEEAQLYQAGERPGVNGWELSKLDRDGDYDGDGTSNWNEYLAGTYALDATSILDLKLAEKLSDSVRLEFYSFYGKQYTVEASTDLQTWAAVALSLTPTTEGVAAPTQSSLTATTTGVTSVYVGTTDTVAHYRLIAR